MNAVNLHSLHRTAENHDIEMNQKIGRLVPWLHNAKINKTNNVSIINELKRIEIIDIHKEKIYRDRAHLITPEQLTEFDEMLRAKVRFAINHGVLVNHLVVQGNQRLLKANTIKAQAKTPVLDDDAITIMSAIEEEESKRNGDGDS